MRPRGQSGSALGGGGTGYGSTSGMRVKNVVDFDSGTNREVNDKIAPPRPAAATRARTVSGAGNNNIGPDKKLGLKSRSVLLDGNYVEADLIIELLIDKIQLIFQELSSHNFKSAEEILDISNVMKTSFSIYENLLSPFLIFILCESNYYEFNFSKTITGSSSCMTLSDAYSQILSDLEIILSIFSIGKRNLIKKTFDTMSMSSSLTSNFSYISLESFNEDYCHIKSNDLQSGKNQRPPTPVPSNDDEEEKMVEVGRGQRGGGGGGGRGGGVGGARGEGGGDEDEDDDEEDGPVSDEHHYLIKLLKDFQLYLTLRRNLLKIHITFNLYSSLHTLETHLKLLQMTLTSTHSETPAAESLFHSLKFEIYCHLNILEGRYSILQGKYLNLILTIEQLHENILNWTHLTKQILPVPRKAYEESDENREREWDDMLGWMCLCYRRYIAILHLLFNEKRKNVNELFSISNNYNAHNTHNTHNYNSYNSNDPHLPSESSTSSLTPQTSFTSRLRSPTFSLSGHACNRCQPYQLCICPDSDYRLINPEMTSLTSAIDQFFHLGKLHFKELSLTLVSLTTDGNLTTRQYVCPSRDQWEIINHSNSSEIMYPRGRGGSGDSSNSLSITSGSRRNSHENIYMSYSNLISPPILASQQRLPGTELIILSRLTPSPAVLGRFSMNHSPTSQHHHQHHHHQHNQHQHQHPQLPKRSISRERSTSAMQELSSTQSSNNLNSSEEMTMTMSSGLGKKQHSLLQNKIQTNSSSNDLSSTTSHKSGRSNSIIHLQPLIPGFSYSHNPLNLHFSSHQLDSSPDDFEHISKSEVETTEYESKWLETNLPHVKSIIEQYITRGLNGNNVRGGGVGVSAPIGAGPAIELFEKKRTPVCAPIFDHSHSTNSHSRGYSIIGSLPGSASAHSAGSFITIGGGGGVGGSPATLGGGGVGFTDCNEYLPSGYLGGNTGVGLTGGAGAAGGAGFNFKQQPTVNSRIFLVGVVLDRRGGELEMKDDSVSGQQMDQLARDLSQIIKNITELISGKKLF